VVIWRKEANHFARVVDRKTGATLLSKPSTSALAQALEAMTRAGQRHRPSASLGLMVREDPDAVVKTELFKIESAINDLYREAQEWSPGEPVAMVAEGGRWRLLVNGEKVRRTS
jgi:hypothetical protein